MSGGEAEELARVSRVDEEKCGGFPKCHKSFRQTTVIPRLVEKASGPGR